jgi:multidrug efflux pump subunit AcrA (membrane-fusion protein)
MRSLVFFAHKVTNRQKVTKWLSFGALPLLGGGIALGSLANNGWLSAQQLVSDKGLASTEKESVANDTAEALTVNVVPISSLRPASLPQKFTGVIAAARSSRLSAKMLGRIEQVLVDIGDDVKEGDVLVQLDTNQLQAERKILVANLDAATSLLNELRKGPRPQEIAQAKAGVDEADANLKYRTANLSRMEQLKESRSISQQEYDESRSAYLMAQAQLEAQQKALDLLEEGTREEKIAAQAATVSGLQAQIVKVDVLLEEQRIVAPFDGRIQKRLIDEGTVVNPGESILEIVEVRAKEVRLGLPVEVARDIEQLDIRLSAGGVVIPARVRRIAPAIDERTRKVEVILVPVSGSAEVRTANTLAADGSSPLNNIEKWSIGEAVTVELRKGGSEAGLWVPATSLTSGTRGLWSVYLAVAKPIEGGAAVVHAQRCEVEVLRTEAGWAQIRGSLAGDENLIVSGIHRLTHGQVVQVKQGKTGEPQ